MSVRSKFFNSPAKISLIIIKLNSFNAWSVEVKHLIFSLLGDSVRSPTKAKRDETEAEPNLKTFYGVQESIPSLAESILGILKCLQAFRRAEVGFIFRFFFVYGLFRLCILHLPLIYSGTINCVEN